MKIWQARTFWVSLAGMVTAVGALAAYLWYRDEPAGAAVVLGVFTAVAAFLANVGSILAGTTGKAEAEHVEARVEQKVERAKEQLTQKVEEECADGDECEPAREGI